MPEPSVPHLSDAGEAEPSPLTNPEDGFVPPPANVSFGEKQADSSLDLGPKPRGKPFLPGNPPGPGRPPGRRNDLTIALHTLIQGHAVGVVKKTLAGCYKGDPHCLRLIVPLLPVYKDHIAIALPAVNRAQDLPAYINAVLEALRLGEISVADAEKLLHFVDVIRAALETDLMARALEAEQIATEFFPAQSELPEIAGPADDDAE